MQLLTEALRAQLPPLYAQESNPDPMVYAKFFAPGTNWTWYVTEGSGEGEDFICFGYVVGLDREWGYFSLNELTAVRVPPFHFRLNATCILLPRRGARCKSAKA